MNIVSLYIIDARNKSIEELNLDRFLTKEDKDFFASFVKEETQKEKLVSLYLKKKYIGDFYLSMDDKPLSKDKFFNISHSKGVIALAISKDYPIGLDIEVLRDYKDDLAKYISNDEEYKHIKDNKSFFEIWTAKEALVKCLGSGLKDNVKNIPALPIAGSKEYKDKIYHSKSAIIDDLVISIALATSEDFKVEILTDF